MIFICLDVHPVALIAADIAVVQKKKILAFFFFISLLGRDSEAAIRS